MKKCILYLVYSSFLQFYKRKIKKGSFYHKDKLRLPSFKAYEDIESRYQNVAFAGINVNHL